MLWVHCLFRAAILVLPLLIGTVAALAHEEMARAEAAPDPTIRPVLELRGGHWFNGEGFGPGHWYVVDGKFTARPPAAVDVVIDLKDRYVLPPLAEAHNHNLQNSWGASRFAQDYLRRGIFYSAQMAASTQDIAPFRAFLNHPGAVDALYAEVTISASDGHPLGIALADAKASGIDLKPEEVIDHSFVAVDGQADLDAKWPGVVERGARLVKVILIESDRYAENRRDATRYGFNGVDPALLPEIVRRSHAMKARVAVHTDTAHDVDVAVRAGADIIAHLPGYRINPPLTIADYRLTDATIAQAAKLGTLFIPTMAASRFFLARYPDRTADINANYKDNITRLRKAGIPLLTGSDLFMGTVIDEIVALDGLGVLPRPALLDSATRVTAKALFPDRTIGLFAEGAEASLIALDGNPLSDLQALRQVRLAIKQGELLSR